MAGRARRGDIWLVDLGLVQKTRPVLILSVEFLDHERAVVTYVPRTTSKCGTRFEVPHQAKGFEAGVIDAQGLGSIPQVKLVRQLSTADTASYVVPIYSVNVRQGQPPLRQKRCRALGELATALQIVMRR